MTMAEEAMDNLIWNDLWQTAHTVKVYALCCSKYANKMRKRKRHFDIAVIATPGIGALLFPISEYFTLAASILTALGGLLEKFTPIATQPESELNELDNLQTQFNKLLTEIEDSIHSFRLDTSVTDIQLKGFLKKKKTFLDELKTKMDKLVRKSPDSDILNNEAAEYITSKYTVI